MEITKFYFLSTKRNIPIEKAIFFLLHLQSVQQSDLQVYYENN